MAKREELEVTVLSREKVTTFPKIATPVVNILVTYVSSGLPPATVIIPEDKWSKEEERRVIRQDLERRLKEKPEVFKV